jgi:hypothetical protein
MVFLPKVLPKFACLKYKGMVYIFEMCDIVFIKTETPKSRQIESQDCLKVANFIV